MKCTIPEISWHNRDPVLSVDIYPSVNEEIYRLASGGADYHLLIWHLKILESGGVNIDIVSDLTRHQKAINVVRWSPTGHLLASGDDDANIIIWNLKTDNIPLLDGETNDKETWLVHKILRGHKEDVYDLCWSPNGLKLLSGSIDNTAIIWDVTKGKSENILIDHKGFVQGVAWDPKGQYIATLCSDRVCRVFDNTGKTVISRTHKGTLPVPESHSLYNKEVKYFHDDTFKSYFRRLTFSSDGNLLVLPSGCIEMDNTKSLHASYIFTLDRLSLPAIVLPSPKHITIATRCCPILFELRNDGPDPIFELPYRMVFAIATDRDVFLYDTQQLLPLAQFHRIHYTRITDLTWSPCGRLLIVSSTDGFCTLITFKKNELGVEYTKEESEDEEVMNTSSVDEQETVKIAKKPNILEQWTLKTPKRLNKSDERKATPIAVRKAPKPPLPAKVEDVTKSNVNDNHLSTTDQDEKQNCVTNYKSQVKLIPDTENKDPDDSIIIIDDSSPVKTQITPSKNADLNSDNKSTDIIKTPTSINKLNKSKDNINNSNSSIKKRKKVNVKTCSIYKFLQKTPVKNTKNKTATLGFKNELDGKVIGESGNSSESLRVPGSNVILIEDSNDSTTAQNISNKINDSDNAESTTEKENIHLEGDSIEAMDKTDKHNDAPNLNVVQSPTSKALAKPARRIQLVTLSSPKRKKHE